MKSKFLLSLLLLHFCFNGGRGNVCTDDTWIPFRDEKCIKLLMDEFLTHDQAKEMCYSQGNSELIRINSVEEQEFVTKLVFVDDQVVENVWLGAIRKEGSENTFQWDDPIHPDMTYAHWAEGSPSNDSKQNCSQLTSSVSQKNSQNFILNFFNQNENTSLDDEDGLWTDVSCLKRNMVICQRGQNWSAEDIQEALMQLRIELIELKTNHESLQVQHGQLKTEFDALPDSVWPRNCQHVDGRNENPNIIYPFDRYQPISVRCDHSTAGGGWTIIQSRKAGPLDEFYLNWLDYEEGFGSISQNYWLGLKVIHALTSTKNQELRVELEDWDDNKVYANYKIFSVENATEFYKLSIGGYEGDAGDSLEWHNKMKFSTYDMDNDESPDVNCAGQKHGGWWFNRCSESNLNGLYFNNGSSVYYDGIHWLAWKELDYSLKSVEMKIRDLTN